LPGLVLKPAAAAGHLDDLGVVEEAVEDRCGRRDVAMVNANRAFSEPLPAPF